MINRNFFFFNYFNFFFFNYFNSIFFYFFCKNHFFKNDFSILKNFNFKKKSFFFLKYYKFFITLKLINSNTNPFMLSFVKFNNNGLVFFDSSIFFFIKFFNKFLLIFFERKNNFLILDSQYKNNFFVFNKIFNLKDLINFQSFFFPKSNYFCKKNWVFFFKLFCKFFNISVFFINDFKLFSTYFNELAQLEIPIASIVPYNYKNVQVDYPIYFNKNNFILIKYLFSVTLQNIFFFNLNYKFYFYKFQYFLNFKKII